MKKLLLAAVTFLFQTNASIADGLMPDRIYLPLTSQHFGIDPSCCNRTSWNQVNPGLILNWQDRFAGLHYSLGIINNSYDEYSPILSVSRTIYENKDFALSGFLAAADYGDNAQYINDNRLDGWVFIPGLQVNYRNYYVQAIPAPQDEGLGAIFSIGLSFPFE